jgi:hypothetical protein
MADVCSQIVTIPQPDNSNICWFNTIMMALLYSQHSRFFLLNDNKLDDKKDKISKILNQTLKRQFVKNIYQKEYFKHMRINKLLKYLNFFSNKENIDIIIQYGYNSSLAIHKFIAKLGKTSLNLNIYKGYIFANVNLLLDNMNIYFNQEVIAEKQYEIGREILKMMGELNIQHFATDPDYLIVNIIDNELDQVFHSLFTPLYNKLFFQIIEFLSKHSLVYKLLLETYGISSQGILTGENEVTYNDNTYILDSCILGNYNDIGAVGHSIAGITCNNNRYIYNGPLISSESYYSTEKVSCDLMRFDWNVKKDDNFCINPKVCKLDPIYQRPFNDLCFSFNKGSRTLIYVKNNMQIDTADLLYKNESRLSPFIIPSSSSS